MLSFWDTKLNIRDRKGQIMNLESILSSVKTSANSFNLNDSFKTIRYISDEEYSDTVHKYVEPMFTETMRSLNSQSPRFILFSAPGATGKTALAQHICYSKHEIVELQNLVCKVLFKMQLV